MTYLNDNKCPLYYKVLHVYLERGVDYTEADLEDDGDGWLTLKRTKLLEIGKTLGYDEIVVSSGEGHSGAKPGTVYVAYNTGVYDLAKEIAENGPEGK